MKGLLFSIEEFSTYDGPGIRMTLFLKGCPLHCSWCHNPEGQNPGAEYIRSPNGCLKCGKCLEVGQRKNGRLVLSEKSVEVCPRHLVRQCGTFYTPEALCALISKNEAVLKMNGGGVTFSGGEPLFQSAFLLECLRLLKGRVHAAVQTSGFADHSTFLSVLNIADYFLYDLKLIDPKQHARYVGADNKLILDNYRSLVESGVPFITRTPLIPGVTDTDDNLKGIAQYLHQLGVKEIELLPYNQYAGSKYSWLLRDYEPEFDPSSPYRFKPEIFQEYGIKATLK